MEEDLSPSPDGPIHPPSPFLIVANKFMGGPVILNVGGKRFATLCFGINIPIEFLQAWSQMEHIG